MPLVRIDHPSGKPAAYRDALAEGVYEAMRLTFAVPEDDRFLILSEHSSTEIVHPDSYLGIPYSDELVVIQITCNDSRSLELGNRHLACSGSSWWRRVSGRDRGHGMWSNASIERTAQGLLRSVWPAAHVER